MESQTGMCLGKKTMNVEVRDGRGLWVGGGVVSCWGTKARGGGWGGWGGGKVGVGGGVLAKRGKRAWHQHPKY